MQSTSKQGQDTMVMTKEGCVYKGFLMHPVVEQCEGCGRRVEQENGVYCGVYPKPELKWRNNGICNMATHVKVEVAKTDQKVNPLKASKRNMR